MPHDRFGVRRPLRFLAHRLELNESQVVELARILDGLKIERAQGDVDDRRALSDFADALAAETFDTAKAGSAGDRRISSAQRLRDTLIKTLAAIHAMLTPEQRVRMAHLIRNGILMM